MQQWPCVQCVALVDSWLALSEGHQSQCCGLGARNAPDWVPPVCNYGFSRKNKQSALVPPSASSQEQHTTLKQTMNHQYTVTAAVTILLTVPAGRDGICVLRVAPRCHHQRVCASVHKTAGGAPRSDAWHSDAKIRALQYAAQETVLRRRVDLDPLCGIQGTRRRQSRTSVHRGVQGAAHLSVPCQHPHPMTGWLAAMQALLDPCLVAPASSLDLKPVHGSERAARIYG